MDVADRPAAHETPPLKRRFAIVGGGLAGLHAAWLLELAGEDCVLFEGRDRFGGRLLTVRPGSGEHPAERASAFDLGATWYWPLVQPGLARLVERLELESLRQDEDGDVIVEGVPPGRTSRVPGFASSPPSVRLAAGMASLADALRSRIRPDRLLASHRVHALKVSGDGVAVDAVDASGVAVRREVDRVLLAIPPRLAAATLTFDVPLPGAIASDWAASATWMAPHAKYVATYPEPFWRRLGLSGGARSGTGPMVEIHDASSPGGLAAVFGFIGVPAAHRRRVPAESLRRSCRAQLVRLLGDEAADPVQEWLQDWARESLTATDADLHPGGHPSRGARQVEDGPWRRRLVGIASEWSTAFHGYVAGAVDASAAGVARLLGPEPGADRPVRPEAR
jgi:monoamine oxidase